MQIHINSMWDDLQSICEHNRTTAIYNKALSSNFLTTNNWRRTQNISHHALAFFRQNVQIVLEETPEPQ